MKKKSLSRLQLVKGYLHRGNLVMIWWCASYLNAVYENALKECLCTLTDLEELML